MEQKPASDMTKRPPTKVFAAVRPVAMTEEEFNDLTPAEQTRFCQQNPTHPLCANGPIDPGGGGDPPDGPGGRNSTLVRD